MAIKSRRVTTTEEKRIVIGLITSTDFINNIYDTIELSYFKNTYLERIADWAISFYEEHEKAPGIHIQDIFDSEKPGLPTEDVDLTETLLIDLSEKYTPEEINTGYLLKTTKNYFQERELEILVGNISVLKEKGDLEEAEKQISKYKKVSFDIDADIYINPGDQKTRERLYLKKEKEDDQFFKLPGDLGNFIGNMKRKDLMAVAASSKKGKSFLLNYFMNQGVMSNKKVAFWSIEMTDTESFARLDKSFVPTVDLNLGAGLYDCPVFDCSHNQTGACSDRLSKVNLKNEQGEIDESVADQHIVCTKCRHKNKQKFVPVVWKEQVHRSTNDMRTMLKEMRKFNKMLDRNCRIIVRDKYSLTMNHIYQDIERMAYRDNFIPEIIIIDYLDILQVTSSSTEQDWKMENEKWKQAARLAGETHSLVITATQGNASAMKAEIFDATNLGGWTGKIQHVNGLISINQTPQEKREGIWRVGVTGLRSEEFYADETCTVLQDLKTGQFHLDSYYNRNIY